MYQVFNTKKVYQSGLLTLGALVLLLGNQTSLAAQPSHVHSKQNSEPGVPWKLHTHGIPPHTTLPFGLGTIFLLDLDNKAGMSKTAMITHPIQPSDSFTSMADELLHLDFSQIMEILNAAPTDNVRRALTLYKSGSTFAYQRDAQGHLLKLSIMTDVLHGVEVTRRYGPNGYDVRLIKVKPETQLHIYRATITSTLGHAAIYAGLTANQTAALQKLLSAKMQLNRQLIRGDKLRVLVQTHSYKGKQLGTQLLAVSYQGRKANVLLFNYDNDYYSPDGFALESDFQRYPFEGNYPVSSPFSPERLNPVTHQVAPHNGTDFAMPVGTTILAPSDGVVSSINSDPASGQYVVIAHENNIVTKYLHLSKVLVEQGQTLRMGTPIALSGDTGRVTGPHLHYEVLINNQPQDPMTVPLPHHPALQGDSLKAFQQFYLPLLAKMQVSVPTSKTQQKGKSAANKNADTQSDSSE